MPANARVNGRAATLRVRMYRVGFGDFFLLTVPAAGGARHILIDCGVHAGDIKSIGDAVADMARETDRHLSLVVVTHRHADHISGFARCAEEFRQFTVDEIWMSWWDDPDQEHAAAFQRNLTSLAAQLQTALAARDDDDSRKLRAMATNITGDGAMGVDGGSNAAALDLLRNRGFKNSPKPRYYKAGDAPELPQDLIAGGLQARILGPPITDALVRQMRSTSEEYLSFSPADAGSSRLRPFHEKWRVPEIAVPGNALDPFKTLDDIKGRVVASQPDAVAAAARRADDTLNNQSLVVLFTFRGKKLLFVGDAQWGNWENFLYGGTAGSPGHTEMLADAKDVLSSIDFYKVGHHGSTNATPIHAVESMRNGLVAMCSTEPGCYGKEDKGTEVPRGALLGALQQKTNGHLACSDQVSAGTSEKSNADRPALDKAFRTTGQLYIDWETAVG